MIMMYMVVYVCMFAHIYVYTCDAWQLVSTWVLCVSWQFMTIVYVVVHICRFARIYVHHCNFMCTIAMRMCTIAMRGHGHPYAYIYVCAGTHIYVNDDAHNSHELPSYMHELPHTRVVWHVFDWYHTQYSRTASQKYSRTATLKYSRTATLKYSRTATLKNHEQHPICTHRHSRHLHEQLQVRVVIHMYDEAPSRRPIRNMYMCITHVYMYMYVYIHTCMIEIYLFGMGLRRGASPHAIVTNCHAAYWRTATH